MSGTVRFNVRSTFSLPTHIMGTSGEVYEFRLGGTREVKRSMYYICLGFGASVFRTEDQIVNKVRGKIEVIARKREEQCELGRPSVYASTQRVAGNDGGRRGVYSAYETPVTVSESACLAFSQDSQNAPLAAGSESQRDRRHLRAPDREVQYAEQSVGNSKGRVKDRWVDIRASTDKRGTAMHDLRVRPAKRHPSHVGKCSLRGASRAETCKRERQIPRPHNRKKREKKTGKKSPLTHETAAAVGGPGRREQRSRQERTGGGAVVFEDRPRVVVLVVLRLGFWHAFRPRRRGKQSGGKEQGGVGDRWMEERCMCDKGMSTDSEGDGWREKRKRWTIRAKDYDGKKGGYKRQGYAVSDGGKVRWACAEEQGRGEEEWTVRVCMKEEGKLRPAPAQMEKAGCDKCKSTAKAKAKDELKNSLIKIYIGPRSALIPHRRRGTRRTRRVDVRMKERAPVMRVRHQRANKEGRRLWIDTRRTVPSDASKDGCPLAPRTSALDAKAGVLATYSASGVGGAVECRGVYARAGQGRTAELLSAGRGPRRTGRARMEQLERRMSAYCKRCFPNIMPECVKFFHPAFSQGFSPNV
ncbi:hypothetical protein B0H16DRAFT_1452410 [Mycena metata]|uniref:Uncharacterized protein n=1 Tax=Mycena metata TaxID=1033252 RepID=A0AAD7JUY2_9AGAR|nr:hypothetical protein B0H16DRAFT_1452410 [Mycena metata]